MIYFVLPILILFGIRTTLTEELIPGTDVISSHLSFYLYSYEILIAFIILWGLFRNKHTYSLWFILSTPILLLLVYVSEDTWLSFLHVVRFINLSGLFLWVSKSTDDQRVENFLKGMVVAVFGIVMIAITQFTLQQSLGLSLFHEPEVSVQQVGVAKIAIRGVEFLRPYSVLPHPNILGWLGVTTIATIVCIHYPKHAWKVLLVSQLGYVLLDHMHWTYPVVQYLLTIIGALVLSQQRKNEQKRVPNQFVLMCISTGLIVLSFSRLAWGIFVALGLIILIVNKKLFHVEQLPLKRYIGMILVVPILFFGSVWRYLQLLQETSLGLRTMYVQRSVQIMRENIVFGTGLGNYINGLAQVYSSNIPIWQYESVHNIFLLMFVELGMMGVGTLIAWWYVYKKNFE